jgi:hypothetical protein
VYVTQDVTPSRETKLRMHMTRVCAR